jgi:uncharacterized protein (TIGR00369 family)
MAENYIETLRLMTQAWQCDHLGHVNVSFYMGWIGDAAFAVAALHGWPREQMMAEQAGVAAVKAEVDYQAELRGGDLVRMESTVESIGERKIVFRHRLIRNRRRQTGDGGAADRRLHRSGPAPVAPVSTQFCHPHRRNLRDTTRRTQGGRSLNMISEFKPADAGFEARVRDSFNRQPAMHLIGATLTTVKPGLCEVEMPRKPEVTQQHGFVQGGIIGMIADSAAGYAAYSLFPADATVLTVEYKMNLMAPADGDPHAGPRSGYSPWPHTHDCGLRCLCRQIGKAAALRHRPRHHDVHAGAS